MFTKIPARTTNTYLTVKHGTWKKFCQIKITTTGTTQPLNNADRHLGVYVNRSNQEADKNTRTKVNPKISPENSSRMETPWETPNLTATQKQKSLGSATRKHPSNRNRAIEIIKHRGHKECQVWLGNAERLVGTPSRHKAAITTPNPRQNTVRTTRTSRSGASTSTKRPWSRAKKGKVPPDLTAKKFRSRSMQLATSGRWPRRKKSKKLLRWHHQHTKCSKKIIVQGRTREGCQIPQAH
jgi:hypothetical protein